MFFITIRRPPRSTRTDTLFPYTTLFRSSRDAILASLICDDDYWIGTEGDPKRASRIGVNANRPLLVLVEHRIGRADRAQGDECRHDPDLSLETLPLAEPMVPAQGVGVDAAIMGLGHGRISRESRRWRS